jgi:hypothetical protein
MENTELQMARKAAAELGYMLAEDFAALCGINESTAESWRKRCKGPSYVLAGNRFLYPTKAVSEWLAGRVKHWATPPAALL